MFVVKSNTQTQEVTLKQVDDGVIIAVNGCNIAKLANNDDRLLLIGGITKERTGLAVTYCDHIKTVWITDAETSREYRDSGY